MAIYDDQCPAEAPIFAAIDAAPPFWGVEHPFARCGKEVRCPIVGNDVVAGESARPICAIYKPTISVATIVVIAYGVVVVAWRNVVVGWGVVIGKTSFIH